MKKLLLAGANGMLGRMVTHVAPPDFEIAPLDLPEFDITDKGQVFSVLTELRPEVIINCAAFTNVDGCETHEDLAARVNGTGAGNLAEAAKNVGAILVHISTDYVFSGEKTTPYLEEDPVGPLSAYGRSKLAGEKAILESGLDRFFILRTSWLYGPGGKNFVETIIRLGKEREELRVVADQAGCPTYTRDLSAAIFNLLAVDARHHGLYGIYHFSNEGSCSWQQFACAIIEQARAAGEPILTRKVVPIRTEEYPLPAQRPAYSVFSKEKYRAVTGAVVPDWETSLARYLENRCHLD